MHQGVFPKSESISLHKKKLIVSVYLTSVCTFDTEKLLHKNLFYTKQTSAQKRSPTRTKTVLHKETSAQSKLSDTSTFGAMLTGNNKS